MAEAEIAILATARESRSPGDVKKERWHRRQAIMVVSQLPECQRDALAILRYAEELLRGFMKPAGPS